MPLDRRGSTQVWEAAAISWEGCVAPSKAPDGASNEITPILPGCQFNICAWHIGLQIFQIHTRKSRCVCVMNSLYSARNYWSLKKEIRHLLRHTWTSDLKFSACPGFGCSHLGTLNTSFHSSPGPYLPSQDIICKGVDVRFQFRASWRAYEGGSCLCIVARHCFVFTY